MNPEGWLYRKKGSELEPWGYFGDKEIVVEAAEGRLTDKCEVWHGHHTQGDWRDAAKIKAFAQRFEKGAQFILDRAIQEAREKEFLASIERERQPLATESEPKKATRGRHLDFQSIAGVAVFLLIIGCLFGLSAMAMWQGSPKQTAAAPITEEQPPAVPAVQIDARPADFFPDGLQPLPKDKCLPLIKDSLAAIDRVVWSHVTANDEANFKVAQYDLLHSTASLMLHNSEQFKKHLLRQLLKSSAAEASQARDKLRENESLLLIPNACDYRNMGEWDVCALAVPFRVLSNEQSIVGTSPMRIRVAYEDHFYDWNLSCLSSPYRKAGQTWRSNFFVDMPIVVPIRKPFEGQAGEACLIEPNYALHQALRKMGKTEFLVFSLGIFQEDRFPMITTILEHNSKDPMIKLHWLKSKPLPTN